MPFYAQGSIKVYYYNFYYLQAVFFCCGLGIPALCEELNRTNHWHKNTPYSTVAVKLYFGLHCVPLVTEPVRTGPASAALHLPAPQQGSRHRQLQIRGMTSDTDPNPAFHFDADPDSDPTMHSDADPDPTTQIFLEFDPLMLQNDPLDGDKEAFSILINILIYHSSR